MTPRSPSFLALSLAILAGACGGGGGGGGTPDSGAGSMTADGKTTVTYDPTDEDFPNPERGFFEPGNLLDGFDFHKVRSDGYTMTFNKVLLGDFVASPISQDFLDNLDAGLARVRQAGVKVLLRFAYGDSDAPKAQILAHIAQLQPLLEKNVDVIVALQAGFIGVDGEWHDSTNGLDDPADRKEILEAELDALPASRMTQIRTPMLKDENWPGPLSDADAWSGSYAARIGHHNDCFLATDTDYGTYPSTQIEKWKSYVADDGQYTPVGGETCQLDPPRSDCDSASAEMERLHWSLLNEQHDADLYAAWKSQGCYDEISRRLGYRFELAKVVFTDKVAPGGELDLEVHVRNVGYAALFNPRPVYAVLDDGTTRRDALLGSVDPRAWASGAETTFSVKLRIPADAAAGTYKLGLWLPDADPQLARRPAYAIRFASQDVWDADGVYNVLSAALPIDPAAPGDTDPGATEFAEIP